jgi:hypothetical protein
MLMRLGEGRSNDPAPDRDNDERDEDGRSRWMKAGTTCAVIFGAILLSSVGIIVWDRMSGDSPSNAAAARPAVSVPATGEVPVPASSGSASADPASPTPTQVTWLQVGLGALPFSATAGPTAIRASVPSGFAHTQPGAVQASIQILGRLSWSAQTSASMHAVAASSTTPAAQAVASLTYGPPTDPSVIPQVAGFQVVTYSPTQAVVNIAMRFNGTLRVLPTTMQWSAGADAGGDWKLAGAPGPLSQTSWAAVDDLTGYILFSGQPTKAGE